MFLLCWTKHIVLRNDNGNTSLKAIILGLFVIAVGAAMLFGVRRTMLAVILIRPSCDQAFNRVKDAFGQSMGPGASLNLLIIALAAIALIKAPRRVVTPTLVAWSVFLLAAAAAALYGPDPAAGTRLLSTLVTYAAAFAAPFAFVHDRRTAEQCFWIGLLSSLPPSALALAELATTPGILFGDSRLESVFSHPNIFAFFLIGVVSLILFMRHSSVVKLTPARNRLLHIYLLVLLVLLLATKTRSAWIAMVVIFAIHALFIDRRWIAFVATLPAALLVPGVAERIGRLSSGNIDTGYAHLNSLAWRQELWDDTLQWMRDNPSILFGHGLDLYQSYLPLFFPQATGQTGVGPHNTILQIYFEMGLAGLCSFTAIFIVLAAELLKGMAYERNGAIVMLALCLGYVIVSFSDNLFDYLQFQWFFWFTLGACVAWIRIRQQASPREVQVKVARASPAATMTS